MKPNAFNLPVKTNDQIQIYYKEWIKIQTLSLSLSKIQLFLFPLSLEIGHKRKTPHEK